MTRLQDLAADMGRSTCPRAAAATPPMAVPAAWTPEEAAAAAALEEVSFPSLAQFWGSTRRFDRIPALSVFTLDL